MALNDKSSVTKEQNDRHRRVLEGLMKLPENRECADCRSKGPRWASVNLGVFVCIQCSGIHRSLGVHISKVRSATLDTWLPEQVTFMQGMGNARANAFWEAELPSSFRRPSENDRVGLESFIRSKYEARRWVSKNEKSPAKVHDERHTSADRPRRSVDNGKHVKGFANFNGSDVKGHDASEGSEPCPDDKKGEHQEASRASRSSTQHVVASSVSSVLEPSQSKEKPRNSLVLPAPKAPQNPLHPVQSTAISKGTKIEAPTDLFDLLNIEEPPKMEETGAVSPTSEDQGWAAFQSAESSDVAEARDQAASSGSEPSASTATCESSTKTDIMAGLEDLFKGSPAVSLGLSDVPRSQKEVKKEDILSLFNKTSMASPYVAHQQHMAALLAQRQFMLNAAAAGSGMKGPIVTAGSQPTPDPSAASRNVATGSNWSAGNSAVAGLVNNSGVHSAGSHFGQIGGATYHQPPTVQAYVSSSSLSEGSHGTNSPFQSLVSSSLTALGASGLASNGSPNKAKTVPLSGFNSLYSNGIGQASSKKPSTGTGSDISSVSTGAAYDFSALTSAALAKQ